MGVGYALHNKVMPKNPQLQALSLIPAVHSCIVHPGLFRLPVGAAISYEGAGAAGVAALLADYLRPSTGFAIPVVEEVGRGACLRLSCSTASTACEDQADEDFPCESYSIRIDSTGIALTADHAAGLARGIQTLRLILPSDILCRERRCAADWAVPFLEIEDRPRFPWRGMHLDVARHFFGVEEICRFIDLIALHRFNRLHLHLTDDQGWRIEILKYPRLAEIGAWRPCTLIGTESARPRLYDNTPHGGFYTHGDLRRIVDFAARRHITIVPELDMPGHMQAAIAAYPELGNGHTPTEPRCHWGVSHHILNVEPGTLTFVRDVLQEVMDLFPGKFIHVGGDEVPKVEWSDSRRVQKRMRELGIHDEAALQGWFTRQIGEFLASHGRRLIGWDEIMDGGLFQGATVMSWRGEAGGIAAATAGYDVVMAAHQFLYFDFYQADPVCEEPLANGTPITTGRVYAYDPVPAGVPEDKRHHILGAQGQLWSEWISTPEHLDYMAFPRACALAEALWIAKDRKNFRDFLERLRPHRGRLAALGCNAHPQP